MEFSDSFERTHSVALSFFRAGWKTIPIHLFSRKHKQQFQSCILLFLFLAFFFRCCFLYFFILSIFVRIFLFSVFFGLLFFFSVHFLALFLCVYFFGVAVSLIEIFQYAISVFCIEMVSDRFDSCWLLRFLFKTVLCVNTPDFLSLPLSETSNVNGARVGNGEHKASESERKRHQQKRK